MKLNAIGFIPVVSDFEHFYLSSLCTKILFDKKVSVEESQGIQSVLFDPVLETVFWKQKKDLFELCRKYKTLERLEISSAFLRHVIRYNWISYNYQEKHLEKDFFLNQAKQIFVSKKSVPEQLKLHKESYNKVANKQDEISSRLKFSEKEKYIFEVARTFVYLKGFRVESRYLVHYSIDLIFKEIARREGFALTMLRYCLRGEISKILKNQKVNQQKILARRRFVTDINVFGKSRLVTGEEARKLVKAIEINEDVGKVNEIGGQTAFAGKVTGRVKIVKTSMDNKKVKKGDILISPATNPDLLPAMVKASAFVTETGGVTSHAAIIAREMRKPCIIGTKIATKVFKDGDLVEVDADKGIVRRIKK
jgi:phosphoenolpyruvate synthase/pyruvate phosphate dikinase